MRLVQLLEILAREVGDHGGGRAHHRRTLLADIQLGEVKAEDFGLADQVPQPPVRGSPAAVLEQATPGEREVRQEPGNAFLGDGDPGASRVARRRSATKSSILR